MHPSPCFTVELITCAGCQEVRNGFNVGGILSSALSVWRTLIIWDGYIRFGMSVVICFKFSNLIQ